MSVNFYKSSVDDISEERMVIHHVEGCAFQLLGHHVYLPNNACQLATVSHLVPSKVTEFDAHLLGVRNLHPTKGREEHGPSSPSCSWILYLFPSIAAMDKNKGNEEKGNAKDDKPKDEKKDKPKEKKDKPKEKKDKPKEKKDKPKEKKTAKTDDRKYAKQGNFDDDLKQLLVAACFKCLRDCP
jgi:hypothetical protein